MSRLQDKLSLLRTPWAWVALGLGTGLAPVGPGTVGSLLGVLFWYGLQDLHWMAYLILVLVLFLAGIPACQRTAQAMQSDDPGSIVWDEVVGMLLAMTALPSHDLVHIALAFLLFRLFDIVKPGPVGWCDRHVHGGLGIMLDDVVAGAMAWCVIFLLNMGGWLAI
ncbi:MAG: hypothetical protein RIQ52_1684 [Pseudomonadota bacterium]|jgi:phosphatidylglycerophosphatase A